MTARHEISAHHPVFQGWRKLSDDDVLMAGDETAVVSCLLSSRGDRWASVLPEWERDIGKTIRVVCDDSGDADGWERVFRRKD